jgi:hypothetical protein
VRRFFLRFGPFFFFFLDKNKGRQIFPGPAAGAGVLAGGGWGGGFGGEGRGEGGLRGVGWRTWGFSSDVRGPRTFLLALQPHRGFFQPAFVWADAGVRLGMGGGQKPRAGFRFASASPRALLRKRSGSAVDSFFGRGSGWRRRDLMPPVRGRNRMERKMGKRGKIRSPGVPGGPPSPGRRDIARSVWGLVAFGAWPKRLTTGSFSPHGGGATCHPPVSDGTKGGGAFLRGSERRVGRFHLPWDEGAGNFRAGRGCAGKKKTRCGGRAAADLFGNGWAGLGGRVEGSKTDPRANAGRGLRRFEPGPIFAGGVRGPSVGRLRFGILGKVYQTRGRAERSA